jgi:hypothetical protein
MVLPHKGKPNSHAWNIQRSFRSNRLPFIPGRGTGPPQASVARLHDRTPVHSVEHTPARRCVRKNKVRVVGGMSTCRADWLLGLPLYHISRHVASTFKRLATTTARCDLNNFYQNRQGKTLGHDIVHDPIHHPYSDCRIVNMQLLYRANVRKSLIFYRPY